MLNILKRIFSTPQIITKILITFLLLLVFKLGTYIPVPLIDTTAIVSMLAGNDFLTILNTFSGGGLSNFSILALGISPYITASIVVQMMQMIIPSLKELAEKGEIGKQKINRITRYATVVLALVQALALLFGLGARPENILVADALANRSMYWFYYVYMAVVITAGSAFTMWLADLITRHGMGNGSSMIICAGIISAIPAMFGALHSEYIAPGVTAANIICYIVILLLYISMILLVVFFEAAKRKVPVQYANRQANMNSGSDIPIKLNSAGVIPVIFASTILSIPLTIVGIMGLTTSTSQGAYWIDQIFNYQQPIGLAVYVLLIYFFSFFYSFLTVDPDKISDNLAKQNAYIPGYRPGEDTKNQLSKMLFRVTLIGATYLTFVALVPIIISKSFGFTSSGASAITIGGTSLLIIVGVAVETAKQLETDSQSNEYKGFIN